MLINATVIVKAPTVEFGGEELVSGTVRACAGGVDDHAATDAQYRAHTRQVELTAKFDGKPLPNARFSLRFAGNKGHDYGDGRTGRTLKMARSSHTNGAAPSALLPEHTRAEDAARRFARFGCHANRHARFARQ